MHTRPMHNSYNVVFAVSWKLKAKITTLMNLYETVLVQGHSHSRSVCMSSYGEGKA